MRGLQKWPWIPAVVLATGCVSSARLYPANAEAAALGILQATYVNSGTGRGEIKLTMPDGESITGEYSTVDGSSYAFGSVYGSVYGPAGVAHGQATTSGYAVAGSSPGMASMVGTKGSVLNCEYFVNNFTGAGAGVCKDLRGRVWKLHF